MRWPIRAARAIVGKRVVSAGSLATIFISTSKLRGHKHPATGQYRSVCANAAHQPEQKRKFDCIQIGFGEAD